MKGCRPFTDEELVDMQSAFCGRAQKRDLAFFVLGTRSGFRVSELLSLKIGDVFECGRIVDRVTVARRKMKGKHESRTVYLHPQVKGFLFAWLLEIRKLGFMHADDWLFVRLDGSGQPVSRNRMWQVLRYTARRLGIIGKIGTHSMRKTFADRLYGHFGNDLARLQKAMGHKDPKSTSQYLSFKEDEIEAAIREAYKV